MALSATLAELETWIRQDADMQAPDDRVTSEECRNRINRSLAQLYDRLVLVDQEYFLKGVTTASNGSGKYDIQNDFATGVVRSITSVMAGGSGYTNGATVTLSQGANATATGVITASGGAITGVTLTSGGFGYVDAAMPSQAWQLQNATVYAGGDAIIASPVFIGNYAYYLVEEFAASDCRVLRVDMTTGAHTTSAVISTNVLEVLAYDSNNNTLVTIDQTTSSVVLIDPTTLAVTSSPVAGAPSFVQYGVVFDPNTGDIFAASSSTVYRLDLAGNILDAFTPGYVISALLTIASAQSPSVLFIQSSLNDLYSVVCSPLGPSLFVSGYPDKIVGAVYVPAVDRLYMSMGLGAPTSAQYYDFNIMSNVDIEPTLVAAGYVPGVCFLTYDAASDEVWYSSFTGGPASSTVVAITTATNTVSTTIATAAGQSDSVARLGQRVIVAGYLAGGVPLNLTTYIYQYGGGTGATIPNYIVLNVSGGTGGQIVAYIESDFYKCKGVWFTNGDGSTPDNGDWSPLRRFSWEQQNALNQASIYGGMTALPLYRIVTEGTRDKVYISPDQLGGTFKLWYYPAPPRLLLPTDRFDGRAGWDEWIVKDVAIQLLMAEESVEQAATLKAVRDEIWQRIQLHAEDREAAQPQRIMDATLMSRRYGPRWAR